MNGVGTYGLPGVSRRPTGGGAGLLAMGANEGSQGLSMIGDAAQQETERNRMNEQMQQQRRAGNVQLGTSLGMMGAAALGAGPVGVAAAGIIGALSGDLF